MSRLQALRTDAPLPWGCEVTEDETLVLFVPRPKGNWQKQPCRAVSLTISCSSKAVYDSGTQYNVEEVVRCGNEARKDAFCRLHARALFYVVASNKEVVSEVSSLHQLAEVLHYPAVHVKDELLGVEGLPSMATVVPAGFNRSLGGASALTQGPRCSLVGCLKVLEPSGFNREVGVRPPAAPCFTHQQCPGVALLVNWVGVDDRGTPAHYQVQSALACGNEAGNKGRCRSHTSMFVVHDTTGTPVGQVGDAQALAGLLHALKVEVVATEQQRRAAAPLALLTTAKVDMVQGSGMKIHLTSAVGCWQHSQCMGVDLVVRQNQGSPLVAVQEGELVVMKASRCGNEAGSRGLCRAHPSWVVLQQEGAAKMMANSYQELARLLQVPSVDFIDGTGAPMSPPNRGGPASVGQGTSGPSGGLEVRMTEAGTLVLDVLSKPVGSWTSRPCRALDLVVDMEQFTLGDQNPNGSVQVQVVRATRCGNESGNKSRCRHHNFSVFKLLSVEGLDLGSTSSTEELARGLGLTGVVLKDAEAGGQVDVATWSPSTNVGSAAKWSSTGAPLPGPSTAFMPQLGLLTCTPWTTRSPERRPASIHTSPDRASTEGSSSSSGYQLSPCASLVGPTYWQAGAGNISSFASILENGTLQLRLGPHPVGSWQTRPCLGLTIEVEEEEDMSLPRTPKGPVFRCGHEARGGTLRCKNHKGGVFHLFSKICVMTVPTLQQLRSAFGVRGVEVVDSITGQVLPGYCEDALLGSLGPTSGVGD